MTETAADPDRAGFPADGHNAEPAMRTQMASPSMYIGKAAGRAGTTVKTLRYYERIGLIHQAARSDGHFRVYDEDTVERVRFIRQAQTLGFSLKEIGEILQVYDQGQCSCGRVGLLIDDKLDLIQRKQAELTALQQELSALKDRLPQAAASRSPRICPVIHPA